jgi:PAS domain S-box-containing protein
VAENNITIQINSDLLKRTEEFLSTDPKSDPRIDYAGYHDLVRELHDFILESEAKWRALTDCCPDYLVILDRNGTILFVNHVPPQRNLEDVVGTTLFDFIDKDGAEVARACLERVYETGKSDRYDIDHLDDDGVFRSYESHVGLISRNEHGPVFIISSRDITARKQAETNLQKAQDGLERRIEERTKELATANIQLRNEIKVRRQAEEKLRQSAELLRIEREALERKNVALREVLDQIDNEKFSLRQQLTTNFEQSVLPILMRLRETSDPARTKILELLERELMEITSPYLVNLQKYSVKLSPRELEICQLIKNGFTSKQIAVALHNSEQTIRKQRKLIRRKLGISNQKVNLASFLATFSHMESEDKTGPPASQS